MRAKIFQVAAAGGAMYSHATVDVLSRGKSYEFPLKYKGLEIDYMVTGFWPIVKHGPPLILKMLFKDMSKYRILHNLSTSPFWPRNRKNIILITTAHELQEIQFPELTKVVMTSFKSWLWRHTITIPGIKCLLDSDYAAATSQLMRDGLIGAGFPKDKIYMTPLGVGPDFIGTPLKKQERKKFKVGTVGTLAPQRNPFFSIEAIKCLAGVDLEYEMWGGRLYSENQILEKIGTDNRIKLMGYVPDAMKVSVYDSLDVFLYPSLFEGFSLPIMEAKSRGLPVILYKGGHISPEVKKYCFEAKSPEHMAEIIQKIKDNGYNEKLRKKVVQDARRFNVERTGMSILNAYEDILTR